MQVVNNYLREGGKKVKKRKQTHLKRDERWEEN